MGIPPYVQQSGPVIRGQNLRASQNLNSFRLFLGRCNISFDKYREKHYLPTVLSRLPKESVVSMNNEEEFEFDLDEEEEDTEEESSPSSKKKSTKMSDEKETIKARKMPISDGIKKRLLKNMKEIRKLKEELESLKEEKESFEKEFEILEDELENLRSEKESLESELNQKVAVVNALEKKLDRTQKDFDNFKKRSSSDLDRQVKLGSKKLIMGLIDVMDNFERAMEEASKNSWRSGVKPILEGLGSIQKGFMKVMEDNGITTIDPLDEPFDPNFHEAVDMVEDSSKPDNTVISVESKGYLLDGMVLRPAKVKVSKGGKPRKGSLSKAKDEKPLDDSGKKKKKEEKPEIEEEMDEVEDIEELDEIEE
ncbi:MAG TPA: nucleotide exchange factor GrpE [Euryarchaeota archaeon]|nr:MAG: nucleotide exchange factor GrpE [Thermoplasmatales archaeon ex4484_6]RLF68349.1 MAG: nucleotide exchange factor GrpE [Thermoplasmata archaeon]HHD15289.1 nucleotide exchange factor GrpE [Euryarchaeota archaeon]